MTNKRITLLHGFLIVMSIHWGGIVLTALFDNIGELLISYDQLPWFRLVIVGIEIPLIIRLLNGKSKKAGIKAKSMLRLGILSIALFIWAQFDYLTVPSSGFCGNALLDGSLDDMLDNRNRNESYVHAIETGLISFGMLIYILMQVKRKAENNESEPQSTID